MEFKISSKEKFDVDVEKVRVLDASDRLKAESRRKTEYSNFMRCLQTAKQEAELEKLVEDRVEDSNKWLEREERLAIELDKLKRAEIVEMKMRQHMRENNQDLRDLERKFKVAYINKELAAQIAEKEAIKMRDKIRDAEAMSVLRKAWNMEDDSVRVLAEETQKKALKYKNELQDQMLFQENQKKYLYEEFLREKKLLDDVIQRIHDEDERDIQIKMCKMKKTREEMQAFQAAREIWRQKHKQEIEEENRRMEEFLLEKSKMATARLIAKNKREEIKSKICDDVAKKIYSDARRRIEREEILQELSQEEEKVRLDQLAREEAEKKIRNRIETRLALDRQVQEQRERARIEAESDAKYREQVLAKLVEEQKLDQLSDQKRRMKMLELRRSIEEMIKDRRVIKAEEMQRQLMDEKYREEEELKRMKLIEEERLRLIQEHADKLVGYLPRGLLREDDLVHLKPDVAARFANAI